MKIQLTKFGEIELLNFIDMTQDEKLQVLDMRNHSDVKAWMYNQGDIGLVEHLNFIKTLESDKEKQYFFLKQNSQIIGSVNFTKIDFEKKQAEFGFYANPFVTVLGIGRILEEVSIYYSFNYLGLSKLLLEVFEDNSKVINLHKKYGFKITKTIQVQGRTVYCMELIKE
jgi:UDP-4-amino-4,6-dideoxy-N-acetyl-beta-L-altrosamine N-acetyltransferase